MSEISTELIKEAVYKLCFEANTCLNKNVYNKIKTYREKRVQNILANAKIACEKKRPLCQDTGQVLIFIQLGQNIKIKGELLQTAVNSVVEKCYKDNFFRKSVVKNAVFDRENTNTNTPAIIYTEFIKEDEIRINVMIKGAGSENKSSLQMMLPTVDETEIVSKIGDSIINAGENACPPMFIGVGIGYTSDKAMLMSKEAFFKDEFTSKELELAEKIKEYVNNKKNYVLDVKVITAPTHIACMPVGITINCHSDRIGKCIIKEGRIIYQNEVPEFVANIENNKELKEINTSELSVLRDLKEGEEILLTGEIYVARDMAHKKIVDEKALDIDFKDKIIFYAGPCPAKPNEIIGSIGPTTASRMDKYAKVLYEKGLLGSIGKGTRSNKIVDIIRKNNAKYFTLQGGIAALLADKVKQCEIIAFEELGTEALYKIYVDKFPLKVEIA